MLFSARTRAARAALRAAYRELDAAAGAREMTAEFLDANDRVVRAERALPWWKRLDIDLFG